MSKEKFNWDHPFVKNLGLVPEDLIWEAWPIKPSYRGEWLCRNKVHFRKIEGVRWFHIDSLLRWFDGLDQPAEKPSEE